MIRIVWLLDIDGVVNALCRKTPTDWPEYFTADIAPDPTAAGGVGGIYPFVWAPALLAEIDRLAVTYQVDVQLSSSWTGKATALKNALGLHIPDAFAPKFSMSTAESKYAAAVGYHRSKVGVIWTDDEIPSFTFGPELFGACLVRPLPQRGLTPEHIALIEDWLKEKRA